MCRWRSAQKHWLPGVRVLPLVWRRVVWKKDRVLPEDTAELIRDMVEIARAGHDLGDDSDADEDSYMQVFEYVRMGVLLINEELQPSHKAPEALQ